MFQRLKLHVGLWLSQPKPGSADVPFVLGSALGLLLILILPHCVEPYMLSTVRDALVMGLLALSYDLLWGKAGVLTLGHTTFLGLGAYGFAVATVQFGLAPVGAILIGLLCTGMVAAAVGYFLLYAGVRLHFFAIVSMAVLIIAQQLATS
jgi:ABC-type branched-subunit amino acid transport system permease subunit